MKLSAAKYFIGALMLVTLTTFIQPSCEASVAVDMMEKPSPYRMKRHLCNTFEGCGKGAKRALQGRVNAYLVDSRFGNEESEKELVVPQRRRELNANLVAEVLEDLLEYLRTNEHYKQGKYILTVTKHYDPSQSPTMPANNQPSSSGELQEIHVVGRGYLDKDE